MAQSPTLSHEAAPARPTCPSCGVEATFHNAGACLDRWVHEAFLRLTTTPASQPPPYSASPRHPSLEEVIAARRWPRSFVVVQTSHGCTVSREVRRSSDTVYLHVVAAADNLPLAVCRAAVCVTDPGDTALKIG